MQAEPVRAEWAQGDVLVLTLQSPPGNVLDAAMVSALRSHLASARAQRLRAVVFQGGGKHFSFGASVEEHLPDRVAAMLRGFHALFRDLVALERPLLAAVRGQCLGGGLELAAFCHRVFAHPEASLGQPEIRLGVFAPIGSLVLPHRVGQAAADDLLLSGRSVTGREALEIGLVDEVADDPAAAALAYAQHAYGDHSLAALGFATKAARWSRHEAFLRHIDAIEALYAGGLMKCADPEEGLRAFLEKRRPHWRDG